MPPFFRNVALISVTSHDSDLQGQNKNNLHWASSRFQRAHSFPEQTQDHGHNKPQLHQVLHLMPNKFQRARSFPVLSPVRTTTKHHNKTQYHQIIYGDTMVLLVIFLAHKRRTFDNKLQYIILQKQIIRYDGGGKDFSCIPKMLPLY